jgi:trans-2,3-dihydro-3-hydroxyanthranilate isomerase
MPLVERPEPRRLAYDVVDVFTSVAFGGNQLAVVHAADGLTTEQLQTLAREFNFSETAFPLEPSEEQRAAGATYALRIFTPSTELPYAGHPSVGTAWLLRELGLLPAGTVVQACGAGLLPLDLATDGGPVRLTGGTPSWGAPADAAQALAAVGLTAAAVDPVAPPRLCGVGLPYVVLPVHPEALARCTPDVGMLAGFAHPLSESSGIYVVAWDGARRTARARMFAGDIGVAEDAATGSAAGAFAVWLAVSGLAPEGESAFEVTQGVEMGRPSVLHATVTVDRGRPTRTTVAGQAVHIASGVIVVPDADSA